MDKFYRQNPPREDLVLKNILSEISNGYLGTSQENKQLKKENAGLRQQLELTKKLIEELVISEQQKAQILQSTPPKK